MAIEHWRPFGALTSWNHFRDIQGEMNRVFDRMLGRTRAAASGAEREPWEPVVGMYETSDELVMEFELPGVREKDVSVSLLGDLLTVKGEREMDPAWSEDKLLRAERAFGRFERVIRLPAAVRTDGVSATYRDGVLEVRLARTDEGKPKAIPIEAW